MRAVFTMTEYPDDFHAGDRLNDLLVKSVNIGLKELSSASGWIPTLIVDTPRGYELLTFPEATDELNLRASAAGRLSAISDATVYALHFEGVLRSEAGDLAVVVVEGAEVGKPHGYRLFGVPGDTPGAVYHGHSEQLFRSTAA